MLRTILYSAIAATVALIVPSETTVKPAFAMASDDPAPKPCAKLKWGSAKWKRCRQRNGLSTTASKETEEALVVGYALAKDGKYEEALSFLRKVESSGDPRILTYIGFSERKLGRVKSAMGYYKKALAIDPQNVATLEYLGEAHLQAGDVKSARAQLATIESICGRDCDAYTLLSKAIAAYPTQTDPSLDKLKRAS
ncbi:MAG: tetratricopeptide repeat protein [Pseudomonadota bacterium]